MNAKYHKLEYEDPLAYPLGHDSLDRIDRLMYDDISIRSLELPVILLSPVSQQQTKLMCFRQGLHLLSSTTDNRSSRADPSGTLYFIVEFDN